MEETNAGNEHLVNETWDYNTNGTMQVQREYIVTGGPSLVDVTALGDRGRRYVPQYRSAVPKPPPAPANELVAGVPVWNGRIDGLHWGWWVGIAIAGLPWLLRIWA